MTNWAQIATDLLFYAYVGSTKSEVRILVFDNYQTCPVPLGEGSMCDLCDLCRNCNFWLLCLVATTVFQQSC